MPPELAEDEAELAAGLAGKPTVTFGFGGALPGKNILLVTPAAWPIRPAIRVTTMPPVAPINATIMFERELECSVLVEGPLSLIISSHAGPMIDPCTWDGIS
jgi:hypothetical protein